LFDSQARLGITELKARNREYPPVSLGRVQEVMFQKLDEAYVEKFSAVMLLR
jgi:hypothetical protein